MMIVCGLLAAGSSAWADDDTDTKCTNRTLRGDYGFAIEGVILTLPGAPIPPGGLPFRGVAMGHFDGRGNYTQVDHVVAGGAPLPAEWTFGSGPYTVNADCTGKLVINVPGSPFSPVKLTFVVVRQGKEIRTVVDPNGTSISATTSIGIRVE
jgi:hypothetical protein